MDNGVANGLYSGVDIGRVGGRPMLNGVAVGAISGVNAMTKPIEVITSGLVFYVDFKNRTSYNGTPNARAQPLNDITNNVNLAFNDNNAIQNFSRLWGGHLQYSHNNIRTGLKKSDFLPYDVGKDITVDAWYYHTTPITGNIRHIFINNAQNQNANNLGWLFAIQNNSVELLVGRDANDLIATPSLLTINTWYHLCAVYSSRIINGQYGWLYINGQEVPSYSVRNSASVLTYQTVADSNYCFTLFFREFFNAWDGFVGRCGEIKLYNRVLSEAEVRHNFLVTKKFYYM